MLYRSVSGMTPSTPSTDVLIPFDLSQSGTDIDVNTGLGRKFLEVRPYIINILFFSSYVLVYRYVICFNNLFM